MKKVADRAYSETIQKLLAKLEDVRTNLSKRADDLAAKNDDAGLKGLADETRQQITRPNGSIEKLLGDVQSELDKAQEELEDKTTEAKIANYESDAAKLRLEAAGLGLGSAQKQRDRAQLIVESARLQGEIARTSEERATINTQIAERGVTAAELELQRAYHESLLHGLNPEMPDRLEDSGFQGRVLSLQCVLTGELAPKDEAERSLVRRMASDLVGMIQWAAILQLKPKVGQPGPTSPPDAFRAVLAILMTNRPPYRLNAPADTNMAGKLEVLSNQLDQLFADQAGDHATVTIQAEPLDFKTDVRWIGLRSDHDLDLLFPTLEPKLRHQVLGVLHLRFATSSHASSNADNSVELIPPGSADEFAYFVDVNSIYMAGKHRNLSFMPMSPDTICPQDGWAISSELSSKGSTNGRGPLFSQPVSFVPDSAVEALKESITKRLGLWKPLRLVGGNGEWTFLIMGNGVNGENRTTFVKNVRKTSTASVDGDASHSIPVDLGFPYLRVQADQ